MAASAKPAASTIVRRHAKPLVVKVDGLSNCSLLIVYGVFVGLLLAVVIGAAFGPPLLLLTPLAEDASTICSDPSCNAVSIVREITGLSPMNQFLSMSMHFQKPRDIERGALFRNEASRFEVAMDISVTGKKTRAGPDEQVVPAATHIREVVCPPHTDWCSGAVLFTENFLAMKSYRVNATLIRPYASFDPEGTLVVDAKLRYNISAVSVNAAATQAEVGFRFFCFTLSTLFLVLFVAVLCIRTTYSHWTLEHKWAITLLSGAALFSNPFILAAIYSPGPEWSLVNTFSTVLFVNLLLSFWLVYMHLVVLAGANRVASSANIVLTTSFYLPKALFMAVFGVVTLFAGVYLVYRLDTDPAFSAWEEAPYASFVLGTGTALAVIYTLWFLLYTAFAVRALMLRSLSKQFVLFLATTFTAFIAVVGAYFAGAVAPVPRDTVTTLAFFMAPNLYVWVFAFANIPGLGQTTVGGFAEAGEAARGEAGRAAASADPDAAGILGDRCRGGRVCHRRRRRRRVRAGR